MAHVLVLEIYRDYGMKIEDATKELQSRLSDTPTTRAQPRPADEATSMMLLQEAMKNSNFRGPKG